MASRSDGTVATRQSARDFGGRLQATSSGADTHGRLRRQWNVSPISAKIDYLIGKRFGPPARRAFLEDLSARRYESPGLDGRDYEATLDLDRRYADLNLGLADLSVAAIAAKVGTTRLLTFAERHLRVVRPLQGGTFTLLPVDV